VLHAQLQFLEPALEEGVAGVDGVTSGIGKCDGFLLKIELAYRLDNKFPPPIWSRRE
jgi:hypothetical protein